MEVRRYFEEGTGRTIWEAVKGNRSLPLRTGTRRVVNGVFYQVMWVQVRLIDDDLRATACELRRA